MDVQLSALARGIVTELLLFWVLTLATHRGCGLAVRVPAEIRTLASYRARVVLSARERNGN